MHSQIIAYFLKLQKTYFVTKTMPNKLKIEWAINLVTQELNKAFAVQKLGFQERFFKRRKYSFRSSLQGYGLCVWFPKVWKLRIGVRLMLFHVMELEVKPSDSLIINLKTEILISAMWCGCLLIHCDRISKSPKIMNVFKRTIHMFLPYPCILSL